MALNPPVGYPQVPAVPELKQQKSQRQNISNRTQCNFVTIISISSCLASGYPSKKFDEKSICQNIVSTLVVDNLLFECNS